MLELNKIYNMDWIEGLRLLDDNSIDCCITSPPYWGLRDYGHDNQIGLEKTPEEYVKKMVLGFREVRRVLKPEGTLWLNLGDTYKSKNLVGIPWMVAFALRNDGWYLRQDIIWHKPNPMPESVTDRCTKAHEYVFLLSKSSEYYYDNEAIKEPNADTSWATKKRINGVKEKQGPKSEYNSKTQNQAFLRGFPRSKTGKNKRSVWTVITKPFKDAHFATFPEDLIRPCVLAGCPKDGIILDTFMGAGTTALVAIKEQRNFIGIELNPEYIKIASDRIQPELAQLRLDM